jgi:hypothetical protein
MTPAAFLKLALSLPGVTTEKLVTGTNINVSGKVFSTTAEPRGIAALKLTLEQQRMLCEAEPQMFRVSPSQWGRHGWTHLDVKTADDTTIRSALWMAWRNRASKRLQEKHPPPTKAEWQ